MKRGRGEHLCGWHIRIIAVINLNCPEGCKSNKETKQPSGNNAIFVVAQATSSLTQKKLSSGTLLLFLTVMAATGMVIWLIVIAVLGWR